MRLVTIGIQSTGTKQCLATHKALEFDASNPHAAADPDHTKIPILDLALDRARRHAEVGCHFFDCEKDSIVTSVAGS